jgi:hypothetical protein
MVGTLLKEYGTADKFAWGYDAGKGECVDMIKAGIVDEDCFGGCEWGGQFIDDE